MSGLGPRAAYGGFGWSPRTASTRDEIGSIWRQCGVTSEFAPLRAVLLHKPGPELASVEDPDRAQMLERPDPAIAAAQHDAMAEAFRAAGVRVHHVEPSVAPSPNLMFTADLFFMTPAGAILARPASTVRAGEERWIARRLADLGIPILRSVHGVGTFEGADAAWLDARTVLIGRGLRTNADGAGQVSGTLMELGVDPIVVDMPPGTMHLMGMLRFPDQDKAVVWPWRLPGTASEALRKRGYRIVSLPDGSEAERNAALNFVTLGPGRILMTAGLPKFEEFYRGLGLECVTVKVDELRKAAGGIGCLTGILERDR